MGINMTCTLCHGTGETSYRQMGRRIVIPCKQCQPTRLRSLYKPSQAKTPYRYRNRSRGDIETPTTPEHEARILAHQERVAREGGDAK